MPPKKKGKKSGSALIDGVDTSSMTREQLEAFAHRLKNEMEREREERNFFQLERDKLRTFWEITRNQLEEANATIRVKDRQIEEAKELAEIDIKHVVQQMKHLQYENQSKIGEIRAEAMTQLKLAQEDHGAQEQELIRDKMELRRLLREKDESIQLQLQQLNLEHSVHLSEMRSSFEKQTKELQELQEQKFNNYKYDTEIKHKMEMNEIVERKNEQIRKLIEEHDKSMNEIKNYYNDVMSNNLSLISTLKEQIEELRKQLKQSEQKSNDILAENKKLIEPLQEAQLKLEQLHKKFAFCERDKIQLARYKQKYTILEKKVNEQKWQIEALEMRNNALIEERDGLKNKFEEAVMEFQQKIGLKSVLLERRLEILQNEAEKREALLSETLIANGTDPQQLAMRIDILIQNKNDMIQELKYELAKLCKMYNDIVDLCNVKFTEYNIPKDEFEKQFEPLQLEDYQEIIKFGKKLYHDTNTI